MVLEESRTHRYPPQVMEKALEMAEGIQVTGAPVRTTRDELVAKVKKRGISSSNEGVEEPPKKRAVEKSKDSKDTVKDVKTTKAEVPKGAESTLPKKQEKDTSKDSESSQPTCSSNQEMVTASDTETERKPAIAENTTEQNPSSPEKESGENPPKESKCENAPSPEKKTTVSVVPPAAKSAPQAEAVAEAVPPAVKSAPQAEAVAAAVPPTAKSIPQAEAVPPTAKSIPQAEAVAAAVPPTTKSTPQAEATGESPAKALSKPLTSEDAKERQPFFNRLYKAVAWKLVAVGGFSPNVNHAELLNSSIQSVKATLDVAFVPLKELADLPQNKSSLENIVCELRCKSVYLGTGCGKSMENAKAVASREALKLFLKKRVIVKICKRKYKGREIEDLVLLDEESKPSNLPPALRNPREIL
ncbi:PREDICTED: CDKN2A-interacting protein [Charadrius vociferus]|uniref:CDKN2A-interacting protein n=1 Tax=Charadrius vociferus TaxID=50402 RepID=UPI00052140F4|nr:PREDICTED: CDKN2A-interacting protein [Charadrius vociferus]